MLAPGSKASASVLFGSDERMLRWLVWFLGALRRRHDAVDDHELDDRHDDEVYADAREPEFCALDGDYVPVDQQRPPGLYFSKRVNKLVDDSDEDGPSAFRVTVETRRVKMPPVSGAMPTTIARVSHRRQQARGPRGTRSRRATSRRVGGTRAGPARSGDESRRPDHLTSRCSG